MTQPPPQEATVRPRVLVVEDDTAVRGLLEVVLAEFGGFAVLACGSGTEALARAGGFAPDLFLLDMQLPDATGTDLSRRLRALPGLSGCPTVLLTGRPDSVEPCRQSDAGIVGILAKPFNPLHLADTLRAFCRIPSDDGG